MGCKLGDAGVLLLVGGIGAGVSLAVGLGALAIPLAGMAAICAILLRRRSGR